MLPKLLLCIIFFLILSSAIAQLSHKTINKHLISMPDLIGMTFKKAQLEIKKRGLRIGAILTDPNVKNIRLGIVDWQNPMPKTEKGKQVYIKRVGLVDLKLGTNNGDTTIGKGVDYMLYPNH